MDWLFPGRRTLRVGEAEVCTWSMDRKAALTLTFDDSVPSHVTTVAPAMTARGLKGTFFVITGKFDGIIPDGSTWRDWRQIAAQGHEIGSHTVTHPNLAWTDLMDAEKLAPELLESKNRINSEITSQRCETLAYPFGGLTPDVEREAAKRYIAARGFIYPVEIPTPPTPLDFYDILPLGIISITTNEYLNSAVDRFLDLGLWLVEAYHGVDQDSWEPFSPAAFARHLDYIQSKVDSNLLWVDTFARVIKYIRERNSTKARGRLKQNEITIDIRTGMNQEIYDEPLTLRVRIPPEWDNITCMQFFAQDSKELTAEVRKSDTMRTALVDIMPRSSQLVLRKQ